MLLKLTIIATLLFNAAEKANIDFNMAEFGMAKEEQLYNQHIQELYSETGLDTMDLDYAIFEQAMNGYYNIRKQDTVLSDKKVITILDFTKSIDEKRLYTIDLENRKVLFHTLAAHGIRSGTDFADRYSNINDSNMSSEGFMVTGNTYHGVMGYSLVLNGLDEGINDLVDFRNVVMHPARATARNGKETAKIGRSLGCPSIDPVYSKEVIDTVKDGTLVYIHGKETDFAQKSDNLNKIIAYFGFLKSVV